MVGGGFTSSVNARVLRCSPVVAGACIAEIRVEATGARGEIAVARALSIGDLIRIRPVGRHAWAYAGPVGFAAQHHPDRALAFPSGRPACAAVAGRAA